MNMKIKEEDKDLNYWKKNCEENLIHTPISVLRYIGELEKAVNNGVLDGVIKCDKCDSVNLHQYSKTTDKCEDCGNVQRFL